MKNILVIGSCGQIGSELTMLLRQRYTGSVVAGYIAGDTMSAAMKESGPAEYVDITNAPQIAAVVDKYAIDTIFNLAALLSAVAEKKPLAAWHVGVDGLLNVLEVAREKHCAVFTPSSIGAFGDKSPKDRTPQDTIQSPQTIYGITKVTGELLSNYYFSRYGVDTRGIRFPGLISYTTPPGGGTTDYAVDIYYAAVEGRTFVCPIQQGTYMDMMYMPDALRAAIELMETDPSRLIHRNAFNLTSMSLEPSLLAASIRQVLPTFTMEYAVDPLRQQIALSWPNSLDDTCAREEWGWQPHYDLDTMTRDMLAKLSQKLR